MIYLTTNLLGVVVRWLMNNKQRFYGSSPGLIRLQSLRLAADPEGHKGRLVVLADLGW